MSTFACIALVFFVAVPLLWLAFKAAWWLLRMALVLCVWGIMLAGAAWRGELK